MDFLKEYQRNKIILGTMRTSHLDDSSAFALFDKALELGITMFDFADIYGDGKSEELFGRYLDARPNLRDKIIIQSKCSIRDGFYDLSYDYIVSSVKNIIKRLNCSYLDILLLHRPDALADFEEVGKAFAYLKSEGLVRHFGVSNFNRYQIELMRKYVNEEIIANQLQFNMYHSWLIDEGIFVNMEEKYAVSHASGTLEYCMLNDINIQAWSILMASWDDGIFIDNEKFPELNCVLDKYAKKYNVSASAIVVAWIARHPAGIKSIVGTTKVNHLEEETRGLDIKLSREEWYDIYLNAKPDKFLP